MRIALTAFLALALGAWITVAFAWVDDRQQRMWRRATLRLARHGRRIRALEAQVAELAARIGLEPTPAGAEGDEEQNATQSAFPQVALEEQTLTTQPIAQAWDDSAAELGDDYMARFRADLDRIARGEVAK